MLLDNSIVTSGAFTASEQEHIDLEKQLLSAFIGYARYDVLGNKSKLTFHRWNDRKVHATQLNALITSFKVDGVNRFNASNAIPVVISKKHVVNGTYGDDGNAMEELLELKLTEDAEKMIAAKKAVIYVASGQHRIAALEQYQNFLEKLKSESVKARERLEKRAVGEVDDMEIEVENEIEKPKRDEIDGSLAFKGQWLVAIYDLGESNVNVDHHFAHIVHPLLCANFTVYTFSCAILTKETCTNEFICCRCDRENRISRTTSVSQPVPARV